MKLTKAEENGCREILGYFDEDKVLRIFAYKFGLDDGTPETMIACLDKQRKSKGWKDTPEMTNKDKAIDYMVRDASDPLDIVNKLVIRKEHLKRYLEFHNMIGQIKKHKAARLKNIILSSWSSTYRVQDDTPEQDDASATPEPPKKQVRKEDDNVPKRKRGPRKKRINPINQMPRPEEPENHNQPHSYREHPPESFTVQPPVPDNFGMQHFGAPCHHFDFVKLLQL